MKNEEKKVIYRIIISFMITVSMMFIFGKLAPLAILSFRLIANMINS